MMTRRRYTQSDNERGATMIEYALLVALLCTAFTGLMSQMGSHTEEMIFHAGESFIAGGDVEEPPVHGH